MDYAPVNGAARRDAEPRDDAQTLLALLSATGDAVLTHTLDGVITRWNGAAERLFGYRAADIVGRSTDLLVPPERRAQDAQWLARLRHGAMVEDADTERMTRSGKRIAVTLRMAPVAGGADAPASAVCVIRARQGRPALPQRGSETMREMAAIVQTAASAIVTADIHGIIDVFNPAAEALFGWRADEVRGTSIACLMPPSAALQHQHYLTQARGDLDHKVIGITREILAARRDGSVFPVSIALGRTELAPGRPYFVAFINDQTAQKAIETNLRNTRDAAEATARTKARFLANMSHEIRTPLNAIIGFSELVLQDSSLSERSADYTRTAHRAARDLLLIINDILDTTKLDSGKAQVEAVAFNLYQLLHDVLRVLEKEARDKLLTLKLDFARDVPQRCIGDPTKIRQILLNLGGNAVKFTHSGMVTFSVRACEHGNVRLSVADTGIGMTEEQQAHVFDPFTQADASTTRRYGGTGLGTTISRQLVELMGGRIWVESRYGQGSTFQFTLALPPAGPGPCLYDETEDSEPLPAPRTFRILLAEDVPTNARLVEARLGPLGHQIDWRPSGRQALQACQQTDYDLVLMDVMMDDMDGLAATTAIRRLARADGSHLPIIALTASVMATDHQRCYDAGMDAILGKPIDFNTLCLRMEQLVPAGRGQASNGSASISSGAAPHFGSVQRFVDLARATRLWGSAEVFRDALLSFCAEHGDDGRRINHSLVNDGSVARQLSHRLKGVAANLTLDRISNLCADLDMTLKSGNLAAARKAATALELVLERLSRTVNEQFSGAGSAGDADATGGANQADLPRLLAALKTGLAALNPDSVAGELQQLQNILGKDRLRPLVGAVQQFDFDHAQALADTLSNEVLSPEA